MALSLFTKNKKAILARCREDYPTKMRHKYAPFYHAMEAQKGTSIRLDGRNIIMLSSNDYLGLAFHVLDASDTIALFAVPVAISFLSWRFVEQPFRTRTLAPTRRAAFAVASLATVILLAGSAGGASVKGPVLTWTTASLAAGASQTFTVTAKVGAHADSTVLVAYRLKPLSSP